MKYLVFGWSEGRDRKTEVPDVLHGTTSELVEEVEAPNPREEADTASYFPLHYIEQEVTLATNLMRGQSFPMKVLMSHNEKDNAEYGLPTVAFYEIPGTESVNG